MSIELLQGGPQTNPPINDKRAYWAAIINSSVAKTAASLLETGRKLIAAQNDLGPDDAWLDMFASRQIRLDLSLAERLMKAARHPTLSDSAILPNLPPHARALAALSRLSGEAIGSCIANGQISSSMTVTATEDFVRKQLANPGGAQNVDEQATGATSIRTEFFALLWDDGDDQPRRSLALSYPEHLYPNMAFFHFYPAGAVLNGSVKTGFKPIALFVVPVEEGVVVKDKQSRTVCKATCRILTLSVRGAAPEPAMVPQQIIEGGYDGVIAMITAMYPHPVLKAVSTTAGEAPRGWDLAPRNNAERAIPDAVEGEPAKTPSTPDGDGKSSQPQ